MQKYAQYAKNKQKNAKNKTLYAKYAKQICKKYTKYGANTRKTFGSV